MFLVSDYDVVQGTDRVVIIIASLILIIGALLVALLFFTRMKQVEMKSQKIYFLGIGVFALMIGLSRLILLYHDYFADDWLDHPLWRFASALALFGLTALNYTIEKNVFTKTKGLIAVWGCIAIPLVILIEKAAATTLMYIASVSLTILPMLIYIYIANQSTGVIRNSALLIILGMVLMFLGQFIFALLFNYEMIGRTTSQLLAFSIALIGLLICTVGFIRGPGSNS
jgi:hypothetical protein